MREALRDIAYVLFPVLGCLPGVLGCNSDPSGGVVKQHNTVNVQLADFLTPPLFNHGDVVTVKDGVQIGIIISYQRWDINDGSRETPYTWAYDIMFQNSTIRYTEDKLELVEKFDWSRPARPGVID